MYGVPTHTVDHVQNLHPLFKNNIAWKKTETKWRIDWSQKNIECQNNSGMNNGIPTILHWV